MATQTYVPRIERVEKVWILDAKLYVPHEHEEIAIVAPPFGSNTYQSIGKTILGNGLRVPTGLYNASLLHVVYCNPPKNDEAGFIDNVRNLMRNNWLWDYVVKAYTDKGIYAIQDIEAKGRSIDIPLSELEKMTLIKNGAKEVNGVRLSSDRIVGFAPVGTYKFGKHTPQTLSVDGDVIISHGIDGAKKLGEVSSKLKNNPITYGVVVSEGNNPELGVSALDECDGRLHVVGGWGDYGRGRAFGVL